MEHTFQPGDACPECQQLGLNKQLRLFRINLQEQIVKCESDTCLYPYQNDLSTAPPQDAGGSYLDELDSCDSFIEQLLHSEPTTTATAARDMPALNFDFSTMQLQPAMATTVVTSVDQKPNIEIQSVQVIKTDYVKQQLKKEKSNIALTQSPETSGGAASIKVESQVDADMPKTRISRYFSALKANQPPAKLEARQPKLAKRKRSQLLVGNKNAEKRRNNTRANTLDDVLQVVQKSQKSASSSAL